MTEDGDEQERARKETQFSNGGTQQSLDTCLYGEFKSSKDECVCYEEGTNFVGHTFAKADYVETYRECQKLCESQPDCVYWSHYTGMPNSNSCFLKNKLATIRRESGNGDSVNFVSGTKYCNLPKTSGIF